MISRKIPSGEKPLERAFFERDAVVCARELVGCTLGYGKTAGIILETEAYAAEGDPACHTWKRQGARDFVARNPPGTAYVYLNYGMHWLLNFLVKGGGHDGFVLIRALEPVTGIGTMILRRNRTKAVDLCNGPAKLTEALGLAGNHHGADPFSDKGWLLTGANIPVNTIASTRVGISQATDYPWRFLMKGSRGVSVPA